MKGFVTPFKVGVVIIAGFVAFAFMFGTISQSVFNTGEGYTVYAHLDDATGLAEQSRVMTAGIAVGVIDSITLEGGRALVAIRLRDDVTLLGGERETLPDGSVLWREGATLTRKQASLLGDYYLEITPGLRGEPLADGDYIPNVVTPPGADTLLEQMARVGDNMEQISEDVQAVTSTFSEVFGGEAGVAKLDALIADLQTMVATLESIAVENQQGLHNIVTNVERISADVASFTSGAGRSVDGILADIQAMTTELRFMIGQSSGDVAEGLGTLRSTLASLQLALDNLNYSLENVQEITDRVADGEGTLGALINDPAIAEQSERLLANANEIVEGVTGLQTWIEMRSEYGMEAHAFKNYLTLSLRPNEDKFYVLELVDDPRGRTDVIRTVTLQNDPDQPPTEFEERTVTTQAFKVSVLFGGRWRLYEDLYLGGRWGIIESTGGLGANLWALDDNIELRLDLFDFGQRENGRLRMAALVDAGILIDEDSIFSRLFLQAGVDDALNPIPRDYFIGGGLTFHDRDLRGLLMTAPVPSF